MSFGPHSASWHPGSIVSKDLRPTTELIECARSRSTPDDHEELQDDDDDAEDSDCSQEIAQEPTAEDDAEEPIVADCSGWEGFENSPEFCVSF
jgi:hypothetical protein